MARNPIKFYYDLLSPPSRALLTFFNVSKLPVNSVPIALRKGEHLTSQFKEDINRFNKVPCINDNGFKLSESVAMFLYLEREYKFDDFWYPKDSKQRALIDEYLSWAHNNIRMATGMLFFTKWREPFQTGKPANDKLVKQYEKGLTTVLNVIENVWLENNPYLAGEQFSIADVFAICDLEQSKIIGYDPCIKRPKLTAWYDRTKPKIEPYFTENHKYIYKYGKRSYPEYLSI